MGLIHRVVLSIVASISILACQTLPRGVNPVMATWLYGDHALPAAFTISGGTQLFRASPGNAQWTTLAERELKPGVKVPVVLYMHGCNGVGGIADQYRALLLSLGYGVFMPDSFQRPGRQACRQAGSLSYRVKLRLEEVEYALNRIRELPWVDQNRVILMGRSEGGNTVDSWSKAGFAAHIIIGSACTLVGGAPAAPEGIPILAIVGERDNYRPGKSCTVNRTAGGSKSIVLPGAGHKVVQYRETREAITAFLHQCCA